MLSTNIKQGQIMIKFVTLKSQPGFCGEYDWHRTRLIWGDKSPVHMRDGDG